MAGVFSPAGPLTLAGIGTTLEQGRRFAAEGGGVVDFAAVTDVDSVALALLFDWMRTARAAGHAITLQNASPSLASLADVYGVRELLPLEEASP